MIGMVNRTVLLRGLRVSCRYYKPQSSNFVNNLPWSSTSLIKPLPAPRREMCLNVNPPSRKAIALQTSDGVPLSYDLIYTSFEYHTIVQYLSVAIPTLSVIFTTISAIIDVEILFPDPWTSANHLWIGVSLLYLNIGTARISSKSPVRIYYNKNTGNYKAVFNDFRPFKIRTLEFRKGEVEQIPPPDKLTIFRHHRYKIKGESLYMFDDFFRYPADLYDMFDEIDNEYREE